VSYTFWFILMKTVTMCAFSEYSMWLVYIMMVVQILRVNNQEPKLRGEFVKEKNRPDFAEGRLLILRGGRGRFKKIGRWL